MVWETISAVIFLITLLIFWFPLSLIWAIGVFVFKLALSVVAAFQSEEIISRLFTGAVTSAIDGVMSFFDIPVWLWDWAKFEHPWWAIIISIVLWGGMSSRS
jgi:hypothetical protein